MKQSAEKHQSASLLRFSTMGSVDDGKSTLIGRLLVDSKGIYEDQLGALKVNAGHDRSAEGFSLALVTDGLKDEREQGITIDVAYRYFSTPKRRFILADTPGHEQYTRNMATGASTADLALVLIDARKGVLTQTKRHSFIASLLGIPRFVVAINKMDLVDFSQNVFDNIRAEYSDFAAKLGIKELRFIPVSALSGDNIVKRSENMPWYHGESLLEHLEDVYVAGDLNQVDFRFPVQGVIRPNQDYRAYSGQIRSGKIKVGDEITVLPSMRKSKVSKIEMFSNDPSKRSLVSAVAPLSVSISLEDEIDVTRGDMLVRSLNIPNIQKRFEAMLVWMNEEVLDLNKNYIIQHTTRQSKIKIEQLRYKVDINSMHRSETTQLGLNEVGRVIINSASPLFLDPYQKNRSCGGFILIDPNSFLTVAAGMILDRMPNQILETENEEIKDNKNLHQETSWVSPAQRQIRSGQKPKTIWYTGLSASGKSSLAKDLESHLFEAGHAVYHLDGDNLRQGLNSNLGFSPEDRSENIRRVAEVAKLFNQAGMSVVCSFISPQIKDRELARQIVGPENFVEIYVSTPLSVCQERDPHGLYKKAQAGLIKDFTGVSAPYEQPIKADLEIDTSKLNRQEALKLTLKILDKVTTQ